MRISYGVRNQEAEKQLFQIREHNHQQWSSGTTRMGQSADNIHRRRFTNHNDAMVIEVNIAGWVIGKILVDNGSSADILFLKTFKMMNLS
jgi:hypothetical protein